MARSNDLPEDVVILILYWLPVKSLLRFMCVCKSWFALVESSSFITKHLHTNLNNDSGGLLVELYSNTFFLLSEETLEVIEKFDLLGDKLDMVGCCNGLICLQTRPAEDVTLWNPATRKLKVLRRFTNLSRDYNSSMFGFGFDVKSNDYKVVRVLYYYNKGRYRDRYRQAAVYNSSSDSWRLINAVVPSFHMDRHGLYLNGIYYWLTEPYYMCAGPTNVLSFDMSGEVFHTTPLPSRFNNWGDLHVVNGSVAVYRLSSELGMCMEMWVLSSVTWTKIYNVGLPENFGRPFGYVKGGLAFLAKGGELVLYDLTALQVKQRNKIESPYSIQTGLVYKESLCRFSLSS